MSSFETYHFKILAGQGSKNLTPYSIPFVCSQSKPFVLVTANEILLFHHYLIADQCNPAQRISPTRLAKQKDEAKGTKHRSCSLTFSLMRLRDLNFFIVLLLPITK
jgi:hypothetical protein